MKTVAIVLDLLAALPFLGAVGIWRESADDKLQAVTKQDLRAKAVALVGLGLVLVYVAYWFRML